VIVKPRKVKKLKRHSDTVIPETWALSECQISAPNIASCRLLLGVRLTFLITFVERYCFYSDYCSAEFFYLTGEKQQRNMKSISRLTSYFDKELLQ
jgi:hypothetical protein